MDFENMPVLPEDEELENKATKEPDDKWAGTLQIAVVGFPKAKYITAFFRLVHIFVAGMCHQLGLELVESTTGAGIARHNPFHNDDKFDIGKLRN